ncbi:MAG: bifunctional hydroxymethylpyrimidine kinase/phosphomethylpyrimidine kinase [Rubrivivax sp.]|nr:MAG: bifunctional hydroxymethylpyrimidine kinase/phosphomethylpyrimidine kinase [Rubrivivax sp.]
MAMAPPILWSIAGHDTSGGAGLSADQRAADALGVHLCPVVAAITAQHSQGVDVVFPVEASVLDAQLAALCQDLPPAAIKTGLLGSVAAIEVLARWVDRLRASKPSLPLVIDPVLGASSGGAAFANEAVLQAYRRELLPRATLITPNRAEARRLLGQEPTHLGPDEDLPSLAASLRALGVQAVVITGGDAPSHTNDHGQPWALDWLDTPHAQGWLASPRIDTPHTHGTGCTFASGAAAALALGHVSADAVVLAKMLTHRALQAGHPAGQGAGPVRAGGHRPPLGALPFLGLGHELPWQLNHGDGSGAPLFQGFTPPEDGLYGILPNAELVAAAAQAGMRCLQLRHKALEGAPTHIEASARHCAAHGATLFINDHWRLALALPPLRGERLGLHLGQEDLLALDDDARAQLLAARSRVVLGLSSHSLWELARAAGCGASLIACGPVQPTTTKDMPWRPQGEHNLRFWTAHSPAPVVAIGGLLHPAELQSFAACQPAALCVVRALGDTPEGIADRLPALRQAVAFGRQTLHATPSPDLPHPVL